MSTYVTASHLKHILIDLSHFHERLSRGQYASFINTFKMIEAHPKSISTVYTNIHVFILYPVETILWVWLGLLSLYIEFAVHSLQLNWKEAKRS